MTSDHPPSEFPDKGILWRRWDDETLRIIAEKAHPVLLFVADPNGLVWPFLRAIFKAMPANDKLRALLSDFYVGLFIEAHALPDDLKALGAGRTYHIAILSPYGLTPMATFDLVSGDPAGVVDDIATVLDRLVEVWADDEEAAARARLGRGQSG